MNKIIISKDAKVCKQSILRGNIKIADGCNVENSTLENVVLKDDVFVCNSNLKDCIIEKGCKIGPFARIRDNSHIMQNVKIGNFCEIKNSVVDKNSKISHLSYVGDATIGCDVNVGAGVIFCNYDGQKKHTTKIGNKVFIGSNSNLIAPLVVEDNAFIAAGTTLVENLIDGDFCVGRTKNIIAQKPNLYRQGFETKLKYFGTDGIRGIYGEKITQKLAYNIGVALASIKENAQVVIGMDTRESSEILMQNVASGVYSKKGSAYFCGTISTAGVSFLTKTLGFDFGVMITASHNPKEYNGIKIFNSKGEKVSFYTQQKVEVFLDKEPKIVLKKPKDCAVDCYYDHLLQICKQSNKKVFLDCANGSVSGYAKQIFEKVCKSVVCINVGGEINQNSGILDIDLFKQNFEKSNCEIGFCFDGDADRVFAIFRGGKVFDGDKILLLLALYHKQKFVVGTLLTNTAIEKELKKHKITLLRVDVGDINISKLIAKKGYAIGGEKCGHIIAEPFCSTGDGVCVALHLLDIFEKDNHLFEKVNNFEMFCQKEQSVKLIDANIIKTDVFKAFLKNLENQNKSLSIIVRKSGTEPVVRICVMGKNEDSCQSVCNKICTFLQTKH